MIIDNHVHVGWFTDGYHSPQEVWNSVVATGVDGMVVSSTSTCAELYKVVIREMLELVRLGGERVRPILWLTPRMMKCRYALPLMLRSKIKWHGIKLHPEAHPEWVGNKRLMNKALEVARTLNVPVMIHTGNRNSCHAARFAPLIAENDEVTFILAHGRPLDETIAILQRCDNVYVDTSFMPTEDVCELINRGLAERVIFGSDAPINKIYYRDITTTVYIRQQIDELRQCLPSATVNTILRRCPY